LSVKRREIVHREPEGGPVGVIGAGGGVEFEDERGRFVSVMGGAFAVGVRGEGQA